MSTTQYYPTDLREEQWALLRGLLPARKCRPAGPGRPPYNLRGVSNGIVYLLKTGCQWRRLPREFGTWSTIYAYFKRWRRDGVWASVLEALRQLERRRLGRQSEPSAGSVESQSIKTATHRSEGGFDSGQKIKGRKRQLLVDTLGVSLAVGVTAADRDERLGLVALLS